MRKQAMDRFRSPRVRIPHPERVTLAFGPKRIVAPLVKLSATGGVLHLSDNRIQEAFADITIPTAFGSVRSPVELLTTAVPGQTDAVAFRFFNMDNADRRKLEQTINKMLHQGLGEKRDGWLKSLARRVRQGR